MVLFWGNMIKIDQKAEYESNKEIEPCSQKLVKTRIMVECQKEQKLFVPNDFVQKYEWLVSWRAGVTKIKDGKQGRDQQLRTVDI